MDLSKGLELYEWAEHAIASSESEEGDAEGDETFVTSREGLAEEEASIGCAL